MPDCSAHNGSTDPAGDLAESLQALLRTLPNQGPYHLRQLAALASCLGQATLGTTRFAVAPRDLRFDHPAWQTQPLLRRALQ